MQRQRVENAAPWPPAKETNPAILLPESGPEYKLKHWWRVLHKAANLFTASFLASSPPNLLAASVRPDMAHLAIGESAVLRYDALRHLLRTAIEKEKDVIIAARPEALSPSGGEASETRLRLSGPRIRREVIGHTQIVYFRNEGPQQFEAELRPLSGCESVQNFIWATPADETVDHIDVETSGADVMFFDVGGNALGTAGHSERA